MEAVQWCEGKHVGAQAVSASSKGGEGKDVWSASLAIQVARFSVVNVEE